MIWGISVSQLDYYYFLINYFFTLHLFLKETLYEYNAHEIKSQAPQVSFILHTSTQKHI